MTAASSKSLTPQTSRPSASRQVPKFSRCRSPTESTGGVFARSVQMPFNALCPAEESSSKKYESALPHALVLLFQISLDDTAMFAQPAFVLLVVFDKRHGSAPWVRGDAALGTLSTACIGALWQVRNIR